MDAIAASALEPATREAIEQFFVVVTLVRGGFMEYATDGLGELLERSLAALPVAIDTIIEWQMTRGASNQTISAWEDIASLVADPLATQALARDLKLVPT